MDRCAWPCVCHACTACTRLWQTRRNLNCRAACTLTKCLRARGSQLACVARCVVVSMHRESPPHLPPEPKGAAFPGLPHPHPSQKGPSLPPPRLEMPSLGGCLPPSALIKGHAHLLLGASFWGMGQALPVDPSNAWPGGHPACVVHAIAASAAVIRRRQGAMMRGLASSSSLLLWGVFPRSAGGDCFDYKQALCTSYYVEITK